CEAGSVFDFGRAMAASPSFLWALNAWRVVFRSGRRVSTPSPLPSLAWWRCASSPGTRDSRCSPAGTAAAHPSETPSVRVIHLAVYGSPGRAPSLTTGVSANLKLSCAFGRHRQSFPSRPHEPIGHAEAAARPVTKNGGLFPGSCSVEKVVFG